MQVDDSTGRTHSSLFARLQARTAEIEAGVLTRISVIGGPAELSDPDYLHGFRAAVPAAIEFGLTVIETGEKHAPPIPTALLMQARLAARHCVSLDTVMRRYVAGRDELNAVLVEEAEEAGSHRVRLAGPLGALSGAFDRLLEQVSEEYALEQLRRPSSTHARLAERIKSLLAGERPDTSDLNYDFGAHHLGLVTEGEAAPDAVRALARSLDGRPLIVHPASNTVWAWIGRREPSDRDELSRTLTAHWPEAIPLSLSEPLPGISGWRLANKQARAVFPLATRRQPKIARYANDALATSMSRDEVLTASFRELYLDPLEYGGDSGAIECKTLQAYFTAGRNGRAAAAALDVSRQTVSNRLKAVERKIGRSLLDCATDLELALRLADLDLI